jgi:hypothetical protein
MADIAKFRPAFDRFYAGEWPYAREAGVGIRLEGSPTDPYAFIDILQGMSCNPPAARRILDSLQNGEAKLTTVTDKLQFNQLGEALGTVGVTLSIVPPGKPADQTVDELVLSMIKGMPADLTSLAADVASLVAERYAMMRDSMQRMPHTLGCYGS